MMTTKSTALGRHLSDFFSRRRISWKRRPTTLPLKGEYEWGCLEEWEDFNCIDTLLDSQEKLTQARQDLEEAQFQIRELRCKVLLLEKSSV
jgi:hypothetical protein